MAKIIKLETHGNIKGNLTVIEKVLPFEIKRVYYIYNVDSSVRGKHRHYKTIQAAVCISGSCVISCKSGKKSRYKNFKLSKPDECLIIKPEDYHTMQEFSKDAILLVMASEHYDPNDYINEEY
jgi:dTDP-4-dehydrorhamnose 3,5-epimerase-like enzyme